MQHDPEDTALQTRPLRQARRIPDYLHEPAGGTAHAWRKVREDLSRDVTGERGIKVAVSLQRLTPVSLGLRRCEISVLQDESLTMRSGSQKPFTGQEEYGMAENRPKKVGIYERSVGRASGSLATVIGIIVLLIVLVVLAIILF